VRGNAPGGLQRPRTAAGPLVVQGKRPPSPDLERTGTLPITRLHGPGMGCPQGNARSIARSSFEPQTASPRPQEDLARPRLSGTRPPRTSCPGTHVPIGCPSGRTRAEAPRGSGEGPEPALRATRGHGTRPPDFPHRTRPEPLPVSPFSPGPSGTAARLAPWNPPCRHDTGPTAGAAPMRFSASFGSRTGPPEPNLAGTETVRSPSDDTARSPAGTHGARTTGTDPQRVGNNPPAVPPPREHIARYPEIRYRRVSEWTYCHIRSSRPTWFSRWASLIAHCGQDSEQAIPCSLS